MAIPDHVKKQAMDAISNKVTTAQIRLYRNNDQPTVFNSEKTATATRSPIPDHVKKAAMDAINYKGTRAQIQMMESKDSVSADNTPGRVRWPMANKIARMHQMGHGADTMHQQMTKDSFGRECG